MFSWRRAKALDVRKQRLASGGVLLPPLGGGFGGCSRFWVQLVQRVPRRTFVMGRCPIPHNVLCFRYLIVTNETVTGY